jgi:hypothetical protein
MKTSQVVMTMKFDRDKDRDLYKEFSPINLLLASHQGKNTEAVLKTLEEIERTMDKGKVYRITIEELK